MEFSNYQNQVIRITHYKKSGDVIDLKDQLIDEMGNMLWHLAMMCYELDTTLETVALRNLAKLRKLQREK